MRVDSTIDDVATRIGRPRSTVTDWANRYGQKSRTETPWAEKRGHAWMVDNARFDAWHNANQQKLDSRRRIKMVARNTEAYTRVA